METVETFRGSALGKWTAHFPAVKYGQQKGDRLILTIYPSLGPVIYLAITQDGDGHFKFVCAEGVNEPGPILHTGDTNMRTRFSIGAREWNNRWCECGPTHHLAAGAGSHIDTILKAAEILNVPVDVVCR